MGGAVVFPFALYIFLKFVLVDWEILFRFAGGISGVRRVFGLERGDGDVGGGTEGAVCRIFKNLYYYEMVIFIDGDGLGAVGCGTGGEG